MTIRMLGVRKQNAEQELPEVTEEISSPDTNIDELTQPISKEIVRKKLTRIGDGFTSWIRKITSTPDGMQSEVEEPLLIAQSGHKITPNEIKGQCEICGGYDSYIFNCFVHGCKKSLCLKHVYFFKEGDKQIPFCLVHYKQMINNQNTWETQRGKR